MCFFDIHTHLVSDDMTCSVWSQNVLSLPVPLAAKHVSVGIHPWFLSEENTEAQLQKLRELLDDSRVVAIGEVGLDKLRGPAVDIQTTVFRQAIGLAEELGLPMVIHCVRAYPELLQLKKEQHPRQPWVIHGFRGKDTVAKELLKHGCWLSFGEKFQEEALRNVPLDKLLVETDESEVSIENIYRHVAEVRGIALDELVMAVKKNVQEVFFKC